jgi:hypothetical protein
MMELLGPLAVQWGLRFAGETEPEAPRAPAGAILER